MTYTFVHDGKGFTPDGPAYETTREEADKRNREQSAQEVEEFKSSLPDRYFAYRASCPNETLSSIVTWMGDDLARVTWRGDTFRSSFGDRRQNFRALSIDGKTHYSGTAYLSAGDYVRMRKVKS